MSADHIEKCAKQMFHMIQLCGNALDKISQNIPWNDKIQIKLYAIYVIKFDFSTHMGVRKSIF